LKYYNQKKPAYHNCRITHNQLQQKNQEYKIRSWKKYEEKNEEMRNKASKQTTSLVGTSHTREKTKDIRLNTPPPPNTTEEADNTSRTTYPTGQFKRRTPIDKVTEGSSTKWTAHQPLSSKR
jgi:hypothetical protein